MGTTSIGDHYFEYSNLKYFRDGAENIEMCSYGEKKDPLGSKAHLDVQNKVQREHLEGKVEKIPSVEIDWENSSKADVEANGLITVYGIDVKIGVKFTYEQAKSADLKLIKFIIAEGPLKTILNQDAGGARNFLANEGTDGRIVSSMWVALKGELASHFDSTGSISAKAVGTDLDVTASGGVSGSQTITLSKGSTFAYGMHKVKDWNQGKTRVENLEADFKGMG